MLNLSDAIRQTTLERVQAAGAIDAIVIGAGATGGLAARLWTEAGLRVLVLDAGVFRSPAHVLGQRIAARAARRVLGTNTLPWQPWRRQPIQAQCYAWASLPQGFVDDLDCPYTTAADHPFVWLRSRQIGGRLVVPGHVREYYRLSHAEGLASGNPHSSRMRVEARPATGSPRQPAALIPAPWIKQEVHRCQNLLLPPLRVRCSYPCC